MNKRILELAEQANANELSYAYYRGEKRPENAVTLHSVDLELFAELIVRKCMDVAKYHTPDTEECEYTWLIHDKIAKYFGVEE